MKYYQWTFFCFLLVCCQQKQRTRTDESNFIFRQNEILPAKDLSKQLDTFLNINACTSVIVFRLKDFDCSECKKYFIDLYKTVRGKTDRVVMLSMSSGYRSIQVFKKMSGINNDTIINYNKPIEEFDRSLNPYIFLYEGNKKVRFYYVPAKTDSRKNEQILDKMIKEL
jgi:hypothetical protein